MVLNLYSLRDVKLERSQPPFVARDDNEARLIIMRANFRPEIYVDLDLFKVGEFDDVTGDISLCDLKRLGLLPMKVKNDENVDE